MKEITFSLTQERCALRVVAYCRVSTKHPDQFGSLEHQCEHFGKLIKDTSGWELVKIYSDTGSGLRTKNRPGYQAMLRDVRKHRFDLLMVKSLSRLGRDTLEIIQLIRRWRNMGIGIYSEVEKVNTLLTSNQIIETILAIAQEESRSKSRSINLVCSSECKAERQS